MKLDVLKCHGSGNDFLLINELTEDLSFSEKERAQLAVSLCSREGLLGADGILYIMKSSRAEARMRVFNADGSEASMCGNGLRCAARFVYEQTGKTTFMMETMKAVLAVEKADDLFEGIETFKVEISPVSFKAGDLPLNIESGSLIDDYLPELSEVVKFTALAVPNPHAVAMVSREQLQTTLQEDLSVRVNQPNHLFPDGVNVSFVYSIEKGKIYVRTFERGVGFTNACGTAMSASSLVTCLLGLNEPEQAIEVYNNGGQVNCVVHNPEGADAWIDLIGNATYVYQASLEAEMETFTYEISNIQSYKEETDRYAVFQERIQDFLKETVR